MVRQAHHPELSRRVISNDQNANPQTTDLILNLHSPIVSVIEISNLKFI
jgi:hypothetical protein